MQEAKYGYINLIAWHTDKNNTALWEFRNINEPFVRGFH